MLKKKVTLKHPIIKEELEESEEETKVNVKQNQNNLALSNTVEDNQKLIEQPSRFKSYCRIRPYEGVNKSFFKVIEEEEGNYNQILTANKSFINSKSISEFGSKFTFDYVFDEEFTQLEIFQETCLPLIENLIENKKSSLILTQGLSDSGKSFTIIGDALHPGILPLSLRLIYDKVASKRSSGIKILCNFIEIYDDGAYDLLSLNRNKQVKIPNNSTTNNLSDVTFYNLDCIQDFSNALNIGNKGKRMNKKSSMSNTIFKLILRHTSEKTYEECSMSFIDTAFPQDKDFISLNDVKGSTANTATNVDLFYHQNYLCSVIKKIAEEGPLRNKNRKGKKSQFQKMEESQLAVYLRYYLYGDEDIVLLTNIKPKLELNEENMKVLYFAQVFETAIRKIDGAGQIKKQKRNVFSHKVDFSTAKKGSDSIDRSIIDTIEIIDTKSIDRNIFKGIALPLKPERSDLQEYENKEYERTKKEYEEMKIKFQEQEKKIKMILAQNAQNAQNDDLTNLTTLANNANSSNELLKGLNLCFDSSGSNEPGNGRRLFNIILVNANIQNLTISNSLSDGNSNSNRNVEVDTTSKKPEATEENLDLDNLDGKIEPPKRKRNPLNSLDDVNSEESGAKNKIKRVRQRVNASGRFSK